MNRKLIAAIVVIIAACIGLHFYAEWEKARFDASLPQPPVPVQEAHTDPHTGHSHGSGEHHAEHAVDPGTAADAQTSSAATLSDDEIAEIEKAKTDMERLNAYWESLSDKEKAELYHANLKAAGLKPPPPGHYYIQRANGEYRLVKRGEPIVSISYVTGFAPTPEQLELYLQLEQELYRAYARNDNAEVNRIHAEIEDLKAQAQGKVPMAGGIFVGEIDPEVLRRANQKRLDEAYRELGLGHMVEAGVSGLPTLDPIAPQQQGDSQ